MTHEIDHMGLPIDPVLRALEDQLGLLTTKYYNALPDAQKAVEAVRAYEEVVNELYRLGWDGYIDIECLLPDDLMPVEYLKRHPNPGGVWNSDW